jgi:hypothetical protein
MNRVQDEIRRESNCESSSQNVPSAPAAIVTNDLFVLHIKYIIIMILPSNTRFKRFGTSRRQAYNAQDALLSITHISPGYHVSITEVSHGYHLHRAQQTPADSLWRSYVCFLSGHREQTTWMPNNWVQDSGVGALEDLSERELHILFPMQKLSFVGTWQKGSFTLHCPTP